MILKIATKYSEPTSKEHPYPVAWEYFDCESIQVSERMPLGEAEEPAGPDMWRFCRPFSEGETVESDRPAVVTVYVMRTESGWRSVGSNTLHAFLLADSGETIERLR